ncbi:MAG: hypothetical protein ACREAA_10530 [Candidatus Polarisedimenticolia bacterium]
MPILDDRKPGRVQVLIGLVAWFILTLVPAFHGHHPTPGNAGSQTDWSCALCAVSSAPELKGSEPQVHPPSQTSWMSPLLDSPLAIDSSRATHGDRAPPIDLV